MNDNHNKENTCTHECCETKETTSDGCCGGNNARHHTESNTILYTCPMHSNIKENKSGSCPECGMNLILVE